MFSLKSFIETASLPNSRIFTIYIPEDRLNTDPFVPLNIRCDVAPNMSEFKTNLTFGQALEAIKEGYKVRLPEWVGYWYKKNGEIWVHKEDGTEVDTPWFKETVFRNDWQIAE